MHVATYIILNFTNTLHFLFIKASCLLFNNSATFQNVNVPFNFIVLKIIQIVMDEINNNLINYLYNIYIYTYVYIYLYPSAWEVQRV